MRLELDPTDVTALLQEAGEATTYAIVQEDSGLLVRVGGVTLGTPAEVDGKLVFDHDFPAEAVALLRSRGATRKAVVGLTPVADLEDEAFAAWRTGLAVAIGDILRYEDVTYEVVQAHTTQADWAPPVVPALFRRLREEVVDPGTGEPVTPAWEAGITVAVGEVFAHEGINYRVVQGHTTQLGWEPPAVPALWEVVE